MAGIEVAVVMVVVFATGVMSGVVVTVAVAIRQENRRGSLTGQSLGLLERKVRRLTGVGVRHQAAHSDGG